MSIIHDSLLNAGKLTDSKLSLLYATITEYF